MTRRGLTPEQAGDSTDPLFRLLGAPTLAWEKRRGAQLTPELEAIAKEDNAEIRELRAEQYALRLPARGSRP